MGSSQSAAAAAPAGAMPAAPLAADAAAPESLVVVSTDVVEDLRSRLKPSVTDIAHNEELSAAYEAGYAAAMREASLQTREALDKQRLHFQQQLVKQQDAHQQRKQAEVDERVHELAREKYSAPHREVECLQERRATLKCYEGLKGVETLVCDPFVTAYTECAERTLQQFVRVK